MRSFTTLIVALSLPLYALAAHGHARRHNGLAQRARGDVLEQRAFSARLTFYDIEVGITACGGRYGPGEYVVALNGAMFGDGYPGPNCGKTITLTVNGKTANAVIVDKCPGCPYGGLDLTRGLFAFYASLDAGVIQGSWVFAGSSPDPPKKPDPTTPPPKPAPTHDDPPPPPPPKHTSTSKPPPPPPSTTSTSTSSKEKESPTSTSSTTSSTHTSSHESSSSSSSSPSINPTGLAQPGGAMPADQSNQNLEGLNEAMINLGGLVEACNDD